MPPLPAVPRIARGSGVPPFPEPLSFVCDQDARPRSGTSRRPSTTSSAAAATGAATRKTLGSPCATAVAIPSRTAAGSAPSDSGLACSRSASTLPGSHTSRRAAKIAPNSATPTEPPSARKRFADAGAKAGSVRALGRLDQGAMARWLGAASIYCLPARYEPFGLSVLEAALAGCALVWGDIPSLREVWGAAAVFVPPDDQAALQFVLDRLIEDGALLAEFGRRARERAALYTPQR